MYNINSCVVCDEQNWGVWSPYNEFEIDGRIYLDNCESFVRQSIHEAPPPPPTMLEVYTALAACIAIYMPCDLIMLAGHTWPFITAELELKSSASEQWNSCNQNLMFLLIKGGVT